MTRMTLFRWLWALAAAVHYLEQGWPEQPLDAVLLGLTAAVLARPGSAGLFVVFLVAEVARVWADLPLLNNHWILSGFVALGLLGAAVSARRLDDAGWAEAAGPTLRGLVIATYALAALHKCNDGYWDPATSCGYRFYAQLLPGLGLPMGPVAARVAIAGSLLLEGGLAVLLAWPRARRLGLLLGAAMHLAFGKLGHAEFSLPMLTLYVFFLPDSAEAELVGLGRRIRALAPNLPGWFLGTAAWLGLILASGGARAPAWRLLYDTTLLACGLGGVVIAWLTRRGGAWTLAGRARPLGAAVLLLYLVHGLSPYLGLKTEATLSMFSNLSVEGGQSNHWWIPASAQVVSWPKRLVRVLETNDPDLKRFANPDLEVPYLTFQRAFQVASDERTVWVRWSEDGVEHTWARAGDDPALEAPQPALLRRLVAFRPRSASGACLH